MCASHILCFSAKAKRNAQMGLKVPSTSSHQVFQRDKALSLEAGDVIAGDYRPKIAISIFRRRSGVVAHRPLHISPSDVWGQ